MHSINDLLTETMGGADQNYEVILVRMVCRNMGLAQNSAKCEDVVTDITSDLVVSAQGGGFQTAIARAKENSSTYDELCKNMKSVFMRGVWYRIQTAIGKKKGQMLSFTDIEAQIQGDTKYNYAIFESTTKTDKDYEYKCYGEMVVEELELMAVELEGKNKFRLARRYRLAKLMVPGILEGKSREELKNEFGVKSRATMKDLFDAMAKAVAMVAKKTQNEILLYRTASLV